MTSLPGGWDEVALRDLCLSITKSDPVDLGRETVRYVDIGSVDGSRHALVGVPEIPAAGVPSRCRQIIRSGDTVFSTVRPYLEKIAYVDDSLDHEFASTGFSVLRPGPRLVPKFLYYFSISSGMLDQVLPYQKGVSYPAVLDREVRATMTPVPPLNEQRRIVDLLEDHLSRLDAAESYIQTIACRAENWHAGLVRRLLWSANYPRASVGSLLREPIRNGRSDRAVQGTEAGTRTLTLTAVTKNAFTDKHSKLTITTADRAAGLWLEPGDVFVQRSNTPALVGTTALYDGPREWAIFPDLLIRLRVDGRKIGASFLTAALRSEDGHGQLRRKARGLAGSMPKIDQAAVAGTEIPLPDLAEQERVLQSVDLATDALEKLLSELDRSLRRCAALRRSLLAAAFSGRILGSETDLSVAREMISA